jgi:biopolymer transport protein ExbB/TolQ
MPIENAIITIIVLCAYITPLAIIAGSKRCWGVEKTYWLLATIFFSWLALILYNSTVLSVSERKVRHRNKQERQHKIEQALRNKQKREQQTKQAEQTETNTTPQTVAPTPAAPMNKDHNVEDSV